MLDVSTGEKVKKFLTQFETEIRKSEKFAEPNEIVSNLITRANVKSPLLPFGMMIKSFRDIPKEFFNLRRPPS